MAGGGAGRVVRIWNRGTLSLPGSLYEALEEFKKSDLAREALGEHIYNEFIKAKTREWDEYRTYVSAWEVDKYLQRF